MYWFRKAHEQLRPGQRAGLVGTNSITQNRARSARLGYIVENGGVITSAVSTQDWPGEANVDVWIVNWIKEPEPPVQHPVLDGRLLDEPIAASLRPWRYAVERARPIAANANRSFFGCLPGDLGFILEPKQASVLLAGKPPAWRDVVRPYLIGNDLTKDPGQQPSRWIIDFGHRTLEQAMEFPEALEIVRERVKPARDHVRRATYRRYWWRFKEPLREMRAAIAPLERYIASPAQAKRIQFSWVSKDVCPSNLVIVFAFDDDYSMGILSAFAHHAWLTAGWSTLEDRLRYTPSTVFSTYPWPPTPSVAQRQAVAAASRDVMVVRNALCAEHQVGLTTLYNHLQDGAFSALAGHHRLLDRAVATAYGWPVATTTEHPDATNERLLALNLAVSDGDQPYVPF